MVLNILIFIRKHLNTGKREFEVHDIKIIVLKIRRIYFSQQLVHSHKILLKKKEGGESLIVLIHNQALLLLTQPKHKLNFEFY